MSEKTRRRDLESKWKKYYLDAARIRIDIEVIRDDIEFEKKGGKIFYAVDTNVIVFYAQPLKDKRFAKNFYDEDETTLEGLAISLVDFIFSRGLVLKRDSLLLMPYLLEEFLLFYSSAFTKANFHNIPATNADVNERIKYYIDRGQHIELKRYLNNTCPNLVRFLGDKNHLDAMTAILRMINIGNQGRLSPIELNEQIPIPNKAEVGKLANKWGKLIGNIWKGQNINTTKKKNTLLITNDALTLAWVALANKKIKEQGKEKEIRLNYITTDQALHELSRSNNFCTDNNFIRHPKQYVACIGNYNEKNFTDKDLNIKNKLANLNKYQSPIDDFLKPLSDTLSTDYIIKLKKFIDDDIQINKIALAITALNTIDSTDVQYEKLKKKHMELVKQKKLIEDDIDTKKIALAITAFNTIDSTDVQYEKLKKKRIELLSLKTMTSLSNEDTELNKVTELVKQMFESGFMRYLSIEEKLISNQIKNESLTLGVVGLNAAYIDLIETSFKTEKKLKDLEHCPRGPVTLIRYKPKEEFFFEYTRILARNRDWRDLYAVIEQQDTAYIKHLIYGLVAADAGEWGMARNCCKEALANSDKKVNNEGLYFYAITLRHYCLNYSDYVRARENLTVAKRTWEARHQDDGKKNDFRFISEDLSLDTAYLNYEAFMPKKSKWSEFSKKEKGPDFVKTWDELCKLAKKIINKETKDDFQCLISGRILRQIYSNKLCLFIHDQFIPPCDSNIPMKILDLQIGKEIHENMWGLIDNDDEFRTSYLISFFLAFVNWHLVSIDSEKSDTEKEKAWEKAREETVDALNYYKLPYENVKFIYFLKILDNRGRLDNLDYSEILIESHRNYES